MLDRALLMGTNKSMSVKINGLNLH